MKPPWKENDIATLLRRLDSYRQQTNPILPELLQERISLYTETVDDRNVGIEQNFSEPESPSIQEASIRDTSSK